MTKAMNVTDPKTSKRKSEYKESENEIENIEVNEDGYY